VREPTNEVRNVVTFGNNEIYPLHMNLESCNRVKIEGNPDVGLEWFSTQSPNKHSIVLIGADSSCARFSTAITITTTQKIFLISIHINTPCTGIPQLEIRTTNGTDVILVTDAMDGENAFDDFGT
jgi:hypothetical protein